MTLQILPTGNAGQILQSNGAGAEPQWVTSAPAGAIEGITIRDESSLLLEQQIVFQH